MRLLLTHPRIARRFHRAQTSNADVPPGAFRTNIRGESSIVAGVDGRRRPADVAQSRGGGRRVYQGDQAGKLGSGADIFSLACVSGGGGVTWVGERVGKGDAADGDE